MTGEELVRHLRAAAEPDPARVLDALLECSGAERGFLLLLRGADLSVLAARHMDGEEVARAREKVSRTLLQRALAEGHPVAATDADLSTVQSLQGQKVRSACVVPLPSCRGAVYLDHRHRSDLDLGLLAGVAGALDAALRSAFELDELRARHGASFGGLVGSSRPMRELFRLLERVAAAPYPVLVCGESGTGKELVAAAIHRRSPRAAAPFVAANCAALPEPLVDSELFGHVKGAFTGADRDRPGLFEQAHGGTLFLDEVACLSPGAQESLLRVLQSGEVRRLGAVKTGTVDVRVIAATNEDLEDSGLFRKDLYYRLNVLRLDLPPLRERREDLPLLADHLLDRVAAETRSPRKRLTKPALGVLVEHAWPGNVRELENALRRAAALSDRDALDVADFAFLKPRPAEADRPAIVPLEDHIRAALVQWGGTLELQQIADRLGLSRKTLWEKKKKWGL